jgi:hypothetical protein
MLLYNLTLHRTIPGHIMSRILMRRFGRSFPSTMVNVVGPRFGVESFRHVSTESEETIATVKKKEEWTWGWSPPANAKLVSDSGGLSIGIGSPDFKFKILVGENFKVDEITEALESLGGLEVSSVEIDERLDSVDHMVFCTGRSPAHLRSICELIF